jgi:hypothetical protein
MNRTWQRQPLVPGTCATFAQYDYWSHGGPPVTGSRPTAALFCLEGDHEGCATMQAEGRCPHSERAYACIVRQRERMARRDALLMREWERQEVA